MKEEKPTCEVELFYTGQQTREDVLVEWLIEKISTSIKNTCKNQNTEKEQQ